MQQRMFRRRPRRCGNVDGPRMAAGPRGFIRSHNAMPSWWASPAARAAKSRSVTGRDDRGRQVAQAGCYPQHPLHGAPPQLAHSAGWSRFPPSRLSWSTRTTMPTALSSGQSLFQTCNPGTSEEALPMTARSATNGTWPLTHLRSEPPTLSQVSSCERRSCPTRSLKAARTDGPGHGQSTSTPQLAELSGLSGPMRQLASNAIRRSEPREHATMSYDLLLFAPRAVDQHDLLRLISQTGGLDVEEITARSTTVVRERGAATPSPSTVRTGLRMRMSPRPATR